MISKLNIRRAVGLFVFSYITVAGAATTSDGEPVVLPSPEFWSTFLELAKVASPFATLYASVIAITQYRERKTIQKEFNIYRDVQAAKRDEQNKEVIIALTANTGAFQELTRTLTQPRRRG